MKKLLSVLLCIGLLAGLVPAALAAETATTPAAGADVWDGSIQRPTTLVKKGGEDYYEITTCAELAYVAQTGGDWLTYNYILANDLILNDVEITWDEDYTCTNAEALKQWTPIGAPGYPFYGDFDGNGHIISGLYMNSTQGDCGLFDVVNDGSISNLTVVNSFVKGTREVGGIASFCFGCTIENCAYYGLVAGDNYVGGIVGHGVCYIIGCTNRGTVAGVGGYIGGIDGGGYPRISNCVNYGNVSGEGSVGGIVGENNIRFAFVKNCANFGEVTGTRAVGGIVGQSGILASVTEGAFPENYPAVADCANFGSVTAEIYAGGIIGGNYNGFFDRDYNLGTVVATGESGEAGGISGGNGLPDDYAGEDRFRGTFTTCYYAQGSAATAFANSHVTPDAVGVAEAKTLDELKMQETYEGWDFDNDWAIDPAVNNGYPYPAALKLEGVSIPVTGVSLDQTELAMTVGDVVYLEATVTPENVNNRECGWDTSDEGVVTVDSYGRLAAVAPGTATVQVTTADGGYRASCAVTVSEPTKDDYELGELILQDSAGNTLSAIPDGGFWAKVPITKNAASGDANVLLATYDDQERFVQMFLADVSGLQQGQTIKVGFWVKNSGEIAKLKAMAVSSLGMMAPLCPAVEVSR